VDYYNETPVIVFRQRGGNTLSITGEKVTEVQVTEAMRAASASLAVSLEGFMVTLRFGDPPSYVLAVEMAEREDRLLTELLVRFENELRLRNIEYVAKRDSQRLGEPVLCVLPPGFFEESRKKRVRQGVPDGQYKVSHVIPDASILDGIRPAAEITLPTKAV